MACASDTPRGHPLKQCFDPEQQLTGYRHEHGSAALRQGLHQEKVDIDRLGAQDVDPVPAQIHVPSPQGQGLADTQPVSASR